MRSPTPAYSPPTVGATTSPCCSTASASPTCCRHPIRACVTRSHTISAARLLLPGFIDVQVNGGGGVLFNEAPTVETIRRIGAAHRRYGTTGFLPTLISDDPVVMRAALIAVEQALTEGVPGLLGIHLEGPYLAPARKGVHDAKYLPRARARGTGLAVCPASRRATGHAGAGPGARREHSHAGRGRA